VAATKPGDNFATALKSVVTDVSRYDWEGDEPLRRPFSRTVIYEMHVAGFIKHPSSGVDPAKRGISSGQILRRNRGTFLAKNGKDFSRYLGLIFLAKEGI
jgi:pullulanase/glycogen debranching enzyme